MRRKSNGAKSRVMPGMANVQNLNTAAKACPIRGESFEFLNFDHFIRVTKPFVGLLPLPKITDKGYGFQHPKL